MKSISNSKTVCMQIFVVAMLAVSMGQSYAAVTVPKTFTAGTPAVAADVNSNFSALVAAMPAVKTSTFTAVTVTTSNVMWGPPVATLTVTPPSNGFVIVSATGSMNLFQNVNGISSITVSVGPALAGYPASNDASQTFMIDSTGGPVQASTVPFHVQEIYPVTGGVTSTFYLFANKGTVTTNYTATVGDVSSGMSDGRFDALFIPGTALPN